MEKDDEVLFGEGFSDKFTEEAIPLVIYNEESRCKLTNLMIF